MITTKIRSLAELKKIKETASAQAKAKAKAKAHAKGKTRVIVRLGQCSVAAKARIIAQALTEEVQKRELNNVVVETKNCSGFCRGEPFVDIIQSDAFRVTYGRVKPSNAFRIIDEHIVNGQVVHDLVIEPEE